MINSIGLQNPGVEGFIKEIVPQTREFGCPIIANVSGSNIDDYLTVSRRLVETQSVDALEINVSCPNVKEGGIEFGKSEKIVAELTQRIVKAVHPVPVIVKLTPIVTNLKKMAKIVEDEGSETV